MRWLFALGLATAPVPLTLEISSPQSAVFVGEPVKLLLQWTGLKDVDIKGLDPADVGRMRFEVTKATGVSRKYVEYHDVIADGIYRPLKLNKGQVVRRTVVLTIGGPPNSPGPGGGSVQAGFLFPDSGRYRLRISIEPVGLTSNMIEFEVRPPTADEREVYTEVTRDPTLLRGGRTQASRERLTQLLGRYPRSQYLRFARLQLIKGQLAAEIDPRTGDSIWTLDEGTRAVYLHSQKAEALRQIDSSEDWGPFDEERLFLGAELSGRLGDGEAEGRFRTMLLARFPVSEKADEARAAEAKRREGARELERILKESSPGASPNP